MLYISTLLLFICCLTISIEARRKCTAVDDVPFSTKVLESPLVVFGKSIVKSIDENNQNLFNVTIQVQFIFKGRQTPRTINITNAGWPEGRKYCQNLAVGEEYIVFLQRLLNETYTSMDFQEVPYEGTPTADILKQTCNLTRLSPYNSSDFVNECPVVSTSVECGGSGDSETSSSTTTSSSLSSSSSFGIKEHRIYPNAVVSANNSTTKTLFVQSSAVPVFEIVTPNKGNNAINQGHLSHPIHTANEDLKSVQTKLPQGDNPKNIGGKQHFNLFGIIAAIFFVLIQ